LNAPSPKEQDRKASPAATTPVNAETPPPSIFSNGNHNNPEISITQPPLPSVISADLGPEASIGSPFKKQRSSLPGFDPEVRKALGLGSSVGGPRRESEGGVSTGFAGGSGTSWPNTQSDSSVAQFEAGSTVKSESTPEAEMEEEL
jgi:hypothetical protein